MESRAGESTPAPSCSTGKAVFQEESPSLLPLAVPREETGLCWRPEPLHFLGVFQGLGLPLASIHVFFPFYPCGNAVRLVRTFPPPPVFHIWEGVEVFCSL